MLRKRMTRIELKYGRSTVPLKYDAARFDVIQTGFHPAPLSDVEIGSKLDRPIGSPPLEDLIDHGETVLLVVPDATRETGSGQIVNLLVRRLIANGTAPQEIAIIFATGIHRKVTDDEKRRLLTPFIAQRIKTIDHDASAPIKNFRVGETAGGISVELNWTLTEYDHIVLVGGVTFHYFAGFTGGRKLICPGLASTRTITETHKLAFDCETKSRRAGVETARLDGNVVHETFVEAVRFAKPIFCISTITNDAGEIVDLFCGDWIASHRAACDAYAASHTIRIPEKRDLVIASCGGYPYDINLIQAHKTLEAASKACNDGGTIIMLAECPDGIGRSDYLDWFAGKNSGELAETLCKNYQVNGQTAWNLLRRAEEFDVRILTSLSNDVVAKTRMKKNVRESEIQKLLDNVPSGYLLPEGATNQIKV
ncbi:MAG: nickel-dependent lactate racemase [Pyrinomonadaceae bacterium]